MYYVLSASYLRVVLWEKISLIYQTLSKYYNDSRSIYWVPADGTSLPTIESVQLLHVVFTQLKVIQVRI